MTRLMLKALQLQGKIRRFIQSEFQPNKTAAMLALRDGECNRCGACCRILFRCPFLTTDADGQFSCRIYAHRFAQCRNFPIHTKDLREVEECSYSFRAPVNARVEQPAARTE